MNVIARKRTQIPSIPSIPIPELSLKNAPQVLDAGRAKTTFPCFQQRSTLLNSTRFNTFDRPVDRRFMMVNDVGWH